MAMISIFAGHAWRDARLAACAAAAGLLSAAAAWAQVEVGAGVGPDAALYYERSPRPAPAVVPLAIAASLAFDATTWATVQASSVPARDLTGLIKRGYYKLELLQTVLLAARAKVPLKEVAEAHDKGKSLREVAQERKVDFDALFEDALALDRRVVEEILPSVMTVSVRGAKKHAEKKAKP